MDEYLSESEVGEHEPYSTLTSEEIVSSGDEFDSAHYYDTSDIINPWQNHSLITTIQKR